MDINELKQFQIFKNLNEDEILRFQKKMKIIKKNQIKFLKFPEIFDRSFIFDLTT